MHSILLCILLLVAAARSDNYQLVWSDEFNGNTLDLTKWQYEVNCDGGGNNELQCYTSSPANLVVRDGALSITAVPQSFNGKSYTSARINTRAYAAWKYGRIDFRAKLPNGIYLWPALWMMPRDNVYGAWAASGEIDIMESRGTTNQVEATVHHGGSWPNNVYTGSGPQQMNFDVSADFHLYSAIWTPDSIQFLVDNSVYHTQTLHRNFWSNRGNNPYTADGQPFDQYFYIIINLAVGGGFFGGNSNSLTLQQAQAWRYPSLTVDYVRVFQLQQSPVNPNPDPVPVPPTPTGPSIPSSCPANACGAAACCFDQKNGAQCYSPSQYSCSVDKFTGLYGLCSGSTSTVCNGACYNPQQYRCSNGQLVQGAEPTSKLDPTTKDLASKSGPTSKASTNANPGAQTTTRAPTTVGPAPTFPSDEVNGINNGMNSGFCQVAPTIAWTVTCLLLLFW